MSMKFGKNQPKPKGFNYKPFYLNEQEQERKKRFGHLHTNDSGEGNSFKPSFRKKSSSSFVTLSPQIIRSIIILIGFIILFVFLINKEFYIPKRFLNFFK